MADGQRAKIGYWEVVSIGVGGMVGGGIFAVLGLAVGLARGGTPVAFAVAGGVALLTTYSYSKLSVTFPSQGGTVAFLDRAFGSGLRTGTLNILLWLSYVVMLSLYAFAFGSYGATFFPAGVQAIAKHALVSFSLIAITVLNLFSVKAVGEAEDWIVGFKILILTLFIATGLWGIQTQRLAPPVWSAPGQLIAGGMIIFVAYEGFELIANTAQDVRDLSRTLPRAYFSAVVFVLVLYVLVTVVTVGSLPIGRIVAAKDYALAEAARPFLGSVGFTLIAIAAMLSTASAINATIYGATRLSYTIAKDGELPVQLEKKVWNEPEGILVTAGLSLLVANLFDLGSLSAMGSAGFLLVFAAVNGANVSLARETGSRRWLSIAGMAACLGALGALIWHTGTHDPSQLLVLGFMLALSLGIEVAYRLASKREIHLPHPAPRR